MPELSRCNGGDDNVSCSGTGPLKTKITDPLEALGLLICDYKSSQRGEDLIDRIREEEKGKDKCGG